jgi:hypothetical protein
MAAAGRAAGRAVAVKEVAAMAGGMEGAVRAVAKGAAVC